MPLPYVSLGRTGLKVSRLCLDTMNFGADTSQEDAFAIMDPRSRLLPNTTLGS